MKFRFLSFLYLVVFFGSPVQSDNRNASFILGSNACDGVKYQFHDCVDRVITECNCYESGVCIGKGRCININTKEHCNFSATSSLFKPSDSIECPSCNATMIKFQLQYAECSPDNIRCFSICGYDTCINKITALEPNDQLYGCNITNFISCELSEADSYASASGLCFNPVTSETCNYSIKMNDRQNYCSVSCDTCSVNSTVYSEFPALDTNTGCQPINCLPDCRNSDQDHNSQFGIIFGQIGGGVLLVTTAAIIIYKCTRKSGYQRIN